jgi:hypothetical protein
MMSLTQPPFRASAHTWTTLLTCSPTKHCAGLGRGAGEGDDGDDSAVPLPPLPVLPVPVPPPAVPPAPLPKAPARTGPLPLVGVPAVGAGDDGVLPPGLDGAEDDGEDRGDDATCGADGDVDGLGGALWAAGG